jgi:Protein of unknown function (DUF2909)
VDVIKVVVLVLLGLIVTSLGKALFHMSSIPEDSAKMVQALTFRIGLSVALFIVLFIAWYAGILTPHSGP